MLDLLNKTTCELCGEEIVWWPENHGRFDPSYIEAVKRTPNISLANVSHETEDSINYRIYCSYCHHEINVYIQKALDY